MRKILISSILIIFIYICVSAQNEPFKLLKCIDTTGNRIVNDNLGNIYLLEKSSLKKYDADGIFLCSYSELSDGLISGIDVSDPLKIIILNADFGKVKFLDNKLSIKGNPISLPDLGFSSASLVAASYESGFWIFDPLSNQLLRFDNNLQISQTSGNISDLTDHEFRPNLIIESGNMVYVNDPLYGIFVFDRYATYMKTIPVKNIVSFQIFNDKIFYLESQSLKSLDIKTYEEKILKLPFLEEGIQNAIIDNRRLSIITKTKFCIYSF
jgi:hypothetical protein